MIADVTTFMRRLVKSALEPLGRPVAAGRDLVNAHPKLALILLALLVVTAVAALRGSRVAALALIPLSLAWLAFNTPFEGPTLVVLSWSHGITASDLVSVAGLGIAAWRLGGVAVAALR